MYVQVICKKNFGKFKIPTGYFFHHIPVAYIDLLFTSNNFNVIFMYFELTCRYGTYVFLTEMLKIKKFHKTQIHAIFSLFIRSQVLIGLLFETKIVQPQIFQEYTKTFTLCNILQNVNTTNK